jgi:hypothetical protein
MNERAAAGKLAYNKFYAIGLFRLLEVLRRSEGCYRLHSEGQEQIVAVGRCIGWALGGL